MVCDGLVRVPQDGRARLVSQAIRRFIGIDLNRVAAHWCRCRLGAGAYGVVDSRAKVEHSFYVVKNLLKHKKARYRGMPEARLENEVRAIRVQGGRICCV